MMDYTGNQKGGERRERARGERERDKRLCVSGTDWEHGDWQASRARHVLALLSLLLLPFLRV